jgi:hypothetical protein
MDCIQTLLQPSEAERALVEHFLLVRSQERQDETFLVLGLCSSDLARRGR